MSCVLAFGADASGVSGSVSRNSGRERNWRRGWRFQSRSGPCAICPSVPDAPPRKLNSEASSLVCLVAQSCLTLCDTVDYSPPGSSVHGVFQVKTLEWVAISSSRGSSRLRDQTLVSCVSCIAGRPLPTEPRESPRCTL